MCNACVPGEDLTYDGRLAGGQDGHVHLRGVAIDVENIITDQFFPGWFDINMPVEGQRDLPAPNHVIADHEENRSGVFFPKVIHP